MRRRLAAQGLVRCVRGVAQVRHGGRQHAVHNERRDLSKGAAHLGVEAEKADDGSGSGGDGADGEAIDRWVALGRVGKVGAVDEDVRGMIGDMEVDG